MKAIQVDLVVHPAYGGEKNESFLYLPEADVLIADYTGNAHVEHHEQTLGEIRRAIQDPSDPQTHSSGYYIKSAKVTEKDVAGEEWEKFVTKFKLQGTVPLEQVNIKYRGVLPELSNKVYIFGGFHEMGEPNEGIVSHIPQITPSACAITEPSFSMGVARWMVEIVNLGKGNYQLRKLYQLPNGKNLAELEQYLME